MARSYLGPARRQSSSPGGHVELRLRLAITFRPFRRSRTVRVSLDVLHVFEGRRRSAELHSAVSQAFNLQGALAGQLNRTVKVLALLEQRVSAKLVPQYLEDLTPSEEYERARQERDQPLVVFPKGWGRPTKKQRRQLEGLL